jgi:hypothetical protein
MKTNYKRLFLWSSLGSIAVGAAVALARRPRRGEHRPLACRKIPRDCDGAVLWTERFEVEEQGKRRFAHDRYSLQPTPFKVWSVLDLSLHQPPGESGPEGASIYHVARTRLYEGSGEGAEAEGEQLLDRFYGVVTVLDEAGRSCGSNVISRGCILEIKECYVGGSSNGVESGEVHRSAAPLLNYRIEYSPSQVAE